MDAEMYGITPRPKMDALENAPPANILKSPRRPDV